MARESRAKKSARPDEEDRLSALPDGPLEHILGFLPAHEVVQTSVLAPRWRHIWKSVRRLHITSPVDWDEYENDGDLRQFVNPLFLLRGHGILDEVKFDYDDRFHEETDIWVRHALLCHAKVITVHIRGDNWMTLEDPPLVSRHLRKLDLFGVAVNNKLLNFASCPALEVLKMTECEIGTEMILSQSINTLHIESSRFCPNRDRTRISVPSLIWLQLNDFRGKAPLLESMPSLETASVKADDWIIEGCDKGDSGECCGTCADCCGNDDHKGSCVLLGGLSSAVNVELTAYSGMFVFRRDLNWCPTFSKMKKLWLNDWCVAVDLYALVCILNHSPVLENLTLLLRKMRMPHFTATIERKDISMEKSALISERLKIVKIKCQEVDDRVCKLLKFLSTLDIEVTIKRTQRVGVRE